ncbi:MAG: hypothetical protein PHF20_01355 [Halothiobacillaceae bacterium]|nr:hypothetical protein [Halothiobacillaceae bacterium]
MSYAAIKYLVERFGQIGGKDLLPAFDLARKAQANWATFENNAKARHALYHRLWDTVSQTLDHNSYLAIHEDVLNALESELAGRTLIIRLSLGWIERSATGPTDFPMIETFLK